MKSKDNTESKSIFVATIDIGLSERMIEDLKNQSFEITKPLYTLFQAKKPGVSCTLYKSGKLTVQGKDLNDFIEFYLEPNILQSVNFTYKDHFINKEARIGIDESGKGDFFGPLCIAGVFAKESSIIKLQEIGVKDSKKLNDRDIIKLAEKIRLCTDYHIVKINPLKYNELITQFGNLNHLLAWGHATAIEQLSQKTGCKTVIIDQFADERVVLTAVKRKKLELNITQRHRAEEDLVVAAASILARDAFLDGIDLLEKKYKQKLPKGASQMTIAAGREFIKTYGQEELHNVAKVHFKTLDSILGKKRE